MSAPEDKRRKEVWPQDHRRQAITTREVGGWVLIAVGLWRFLSWPENGPSQWDAISTLLILSFGGAGALPKAATLMASWLVQASPWGSKKDE